MKEKLPQFANTKLNDRLVISVTDKVLCSVLSLDLFKKSQTLRTWNVSNRHTFPFFLSVTLPAPHPKKMPSAWCD